MITEHDIENWFTYHSPNEDQSKRYEELRNQAPVIAETLSNVLTQDAVGIHLPDGIDLEYLTDIKNDNPYFALTN